MPPTAITIHPLDLLFFRGGRPFGAGLPGVSSLPTPQALLGLIRTLLLERNNADLSKMRGIADTQQAFAAAGCPWLASVSVRGPFLLHEQRGMVFPAPASLAFVQAADAPEPRLLQPLKSSVPGWVPPLPNARPLVLQGARVKERPQWITSEGLKQVLEGTPPEGAHLLKSRDLFELDERTGIGIDPATLATQEGIIYTARKLALRPPVCFYAEIHGLPSGQERHFAKESLTPWGGERHHVVIRPARPVEWPSAPAKEERTLVYFATPCFDVDGGLPAAFDSNSVRAAVTVGPAAISGWDLAKGGPKPARFGVDAGSVVFLENAPVPQSFSNPADAQAGYGFFLKGTWTYAN